MHMLGHSSITHTSVCGTRKGHVCHHVLLRRTNDCTQLLSNRNNNCLSICHEALGGSGPRRLPKSFFLFGVMGRDPNGCRQTPSCMSPKAGPFMSFGWYLAQGQCSEDVLEPPPSTFRVLSTMGLEAGTFSAQSYNQPKFYRPWVIGRWHLLRWIRKVPFGNLKGN